MEIRDFDRAPPRPARLLLAICVLLAAPAVHFSAVTTSPQESAAPPIVDAPEAPAGPPVVAGLDEVVLDVPQPRPLTLFGETTPATPDSRDGQAVELGMRFRADVPGAIAGVRFYKSAANHGPHTASLWTHDGDRLAIAPFDSETT